MTAKKFRFHLSEEFDLQHFTTSNLPHFREISKDVRKHWNDEDEVIFVTLMNDALEDIGYKRDIRNVRLSTESSNPKREAFVVFSVIPKEGFHWNTKESEAIKKELTAQITDGWGENMVFVPVKLKDGSTAHYSIC